MAGIMGLMPTIFHSAGKCSFSFQLKNKSIIFAISIKEKLR